MIRALALGLIGVLFSSWVVADDAAYVGTPAWQERRLFQPNSTERAEESAGRVFIYDGMKDSTVERAMSEEFERIDSMMFIRIKRSQPRPEANIVTYVEDDDC